jgi:hypothetical protein
VKGSVSPVRLTVPLRRNKTLTDFSKESTMSKKIRILAVAALAAAGIAYAQAPIMDMVVQKVIQKYQSSTCEQLWQQKSAPKSPEEQRVIGLLKSDPQMRTAFINQVAAPIANKMFECGMIP